MGPTRTLFRKILLLLLPWLSHSLYAEASGASGITFRDVLPILQKNCQACHRPGESAPMSLLDYQSARPWAKAIRTAVLTKTMPPWFADPNYGHFSNDRTLTENEIQTLVAWVDSGAPEGAPSVKSAVSSQPKDWSIRPDLILEMPEPYTVPAAGVLQYVYVIVPVGLTSDTWVTAAEILPGSRSTVHHVSAIIRPSGAKWLRDVKPGIPYIPEADSREGQPDSNDPQAGLIDAGDEFLAGYAPGMQPQRFDVDHSAKRIPAGSDIVFQIHYTSTGKEVQDRTRIGLTVTKTRPAKEFYSATALSWGWEIPPGDSNFEAHARLTFGEPVELVSLQPHMHLRGKDLTIGVTYPSGSTEVLLSVPHYNFAWQIIYYLKQPLPLPRGSKIDVTAHWDNSANNPANPDPTKTVRWGNQTFDEMLSLPMGVLIPLTD
jgi:mono/diheme cytochrome c family protein